MKTIATIGVIAGLFSALVPPFDWLNVVGIIFACINSFWLGVYTEHDLSRGQQKQGWQYDR